jgi:hypothetical protein
MGTRGKGPAVVARSHSESDEPHDQYAETVVASLLHSGQLRLIPDRRQYPERRTKATGGVVQRCAASSDLARPADARQAVGLNLRDCP